MPYLNSSRKGCPSGMKICVLTHLGLIKWKTNSKKIKNGRRPQKKLKMEDNLRKNKKWKTTSKIKKCRQPRKKNEDDLKKMRKKMKTTSIFFIK